MFKFADTFAPRLEAWICVDPILAAAWYSGEIPLRENNETPGRSAPGGPQTWHPQSGTSQKRAIPTGYVAAVQRWFRSPPGPGGCAARYMPTAPGRGSAPASPALFPIRPLRFLLRPGARGRGER